MAGSSSGGSARRVIYPIGRNQSMFMTSQRLTQGAIKLQIRFYAVLRAISANIYRVLVTSYRFLIAIAKASTHCFVRRVVFEVSADLFNLSQFFFLATCFFFNRSQFLLESDASVLNVNDARIQNLNGLSNPNVIARIKSRLDQVISSILA